MITDIDGASGARLALIYFISALVASLSMMLSIMLSSIISLKKDKRCLYFLAVLYFSLDICEVIFVAGGWFGVADYNHGCMGGIG